MEKKNKTKNWLTWATFSPIFCWWMDAFCWKMRKSLRECTGKINNQTKESNKLRLGKSRKTQSASFVVLRLWKKMIILVCWSNVPHLWCFLFFFVIDTINLVNFSLSFSIVWLFSLFRIKGKSNRRDIKSVKPKVSGFYI